LQQILLFGGPPRFFSPIAKSWANAASRRRKRRWARDRRKSRSAMILESAKQLNQELKQVLTENQIYRIDHYLGKETVQKRDGFRFSKNIIEPLWNRITSTSADYRGGNRRRGHRGGFYETAGALRDRVPNHCSNF